MSLILDRLVKIDVQVQVDYEDLQADVREAVDERIAGALGVQQGNDRLSDDSDDEDLDADPENIVASEVKDVLENADKVDAVLDLLFRYYDEAFRATSGTVRQGALEMLLTQFMNIILPTQRSRHTQFLLFHFAQTSPDFVDTFVGTCASTAFDKNQSTLVRQSAAAYLASFVARGMHVSPSIVRDVFEYIGAELNRLRIIYEPNCHGPNLRRYSAYYCLVQALLYIFCFRWRDLKYNDEEESDDEDSPRPYGYEHQWRPGVKEILTLNIFSPKLNPLKICQPDLVEQFAEIANRLGVIYVFGLLETNKRIHFTTSGSTSMGAYGHPSRETALSARKDDEHHYLDGYFPFDPITLPKSKKWVEGDCREWTGLPGGDNHDDDDSDSDVDDVEDSEVEDDTATEGSRDAL